MLDGYCQAFSSFLRGGDGDALAPYVVAGAELAFLDVYRNGFVKSCSDVLRANYPAVQRLVGEECFTALARHHVDRRPPSRAALTGYGEDFAHTIEATREQHGLAYLGCMARLDRAWTEIAFADDADTGAPALTRLARLPPAKLADLRCRLAGAARLLCLEFSTVEVWARVRSGALRHPARVQRSPNKVLMWRRGGEISYRALDGAEQIFVAALAGGWRSADAALAAVAHDAGFDVSNRFSALLREGIVTFEPANPKGD